MKRLLLLLVLLSPFTVAQAVDVKIKWEASVSNNGVDITYNLYCSIDGGTSDKINTDLIDALFYDFAIEEDTNYLCYATASFKGWESVPSVTLEFLIPKPPTNLQVN